ncbi:MAG: DUF368 domain-containing protein [Pseudohongiellaceae bacterium]
MNTDKEAVNKIDRVTALLLFFKGVAMGVGDSIPGVSGGTIAVITNIYEQLIQAISQFNLQAIRLLMSARFKLLWQHIHGDFLLILAAGILAGLLISANSVLYLLENYFEILMAFFIGLVFASVWLLRIELRWSKWSCQLAAAFGCGAVVLISMLPSQSAEIGYFIVFCSGMVAICAMILPGLSGAFILLILGVYEFILSALVGLKFDYIIVFAGGCIVGLLSFTHLLAWLLSHYRESVYASISGMLIGSVYALWPWRIPTIDIEGQAYGMRYVLPTSYEGFTGSPPQVVEILISLLLGVFCVALLHRAFNTSEGRK